MACACKNKGNNTQATRVKQVVKSNRVSPSESGIKTSSNGVQRVTKRVIYRRSI